MFPKALELEPHHLMVLVSYLGHSLGRSFYPFAIMQSMYSIAPTDYVPIENELVCLYISSLKLKDT